jgi:hypothetical protein
VSGSIAPEIGHRLAKDTPLKRRALRLDEEDRNTEDIATLLRHTDAIENSIAADTGNNTWPSTS